MSRRTHRIEDLLRNELSEILTQQVQDPRVSLTSISGVDVSKDLRHATISVSVLDPNADREEVIAAIVRARKFIRHKLASRLRRMRAIPELRFELDRGAEYSERINDLLETDE